MQNAAKNITVPDCRLAEETSCNYNENKTYNWL